jgi:NADPH:quinone reductase-like Zn-dependent oxidoreductase
VNAPRNRHSEFKKRELDLQESRSVRNCDFLTKLAAAECIDYHTDRFEEKVSNANVIFDTVGGDTLKRSWDLLKPSGRLVTMAGDSEGTNDERIEKAFLIVEPNSKQLADVAALIDRDELQVVVDAIVPLENAAEAYCGKIRNRKGRGKVALTLDPRAYLKATS